MPLVVPLQAVPSQTVNAVLGGQNVTLRVYQKAFGLFMDVLVNSVLVIGGVLCENQDLIVRSKYLGFIGDFAWVDLNAPTPLTGSAPSATGIGAQFLLYYLSPSDIPAGLPVGTS